MESSAGREYCYNDVVYSDDAFKICAKIDDLVKTFDCCDSKSDGNNFWASDCKQRNSESNCSSEAECLEVYKKAFEFVNASKLETDQATTSNNEKQEEKV